MSDYYVYLIPLPHAVHGFITPNDDDSYTIYINQNLSLEQRLDALKHELKHLTEGHLYSLDDVSSIERQMLP